LFFKFDKKDRFEAKQTNDCLIDDSKSHMRLSQPYDRTNLNLAKTSKGFHK